MNVASLELSKELYLWSGWRDTSLWYSDFGDVKQKSNAGDWELENTAPAYDLGCLLRKLPQTASHRDAREFFLTHTAAGRWSAGYRGWRHELANTPEDAAARLAIELFKNGIFMREKN